MRCVRLQNEKEKFSGRGENSQRNVTDLAGSLVTSCRPPGRLQKRPDALSPIRLGTGQGAVMRCCWEGNRRSDVALALRHRLQWRIHLQEKRCTLSTLLIGNESALEIIIINNK